MLPLPSDGGGDGPTPSDHHVAHSYRTVGGGSFVSTPFEWNTEHPLDFRLRDDGTGFTITAAKGGAGRPTT